jgi:hypothetical protein
VKEATVVRKTRRLFSVLITCFALLLTAAAPAFATPDQPHQILTVDPVPPMVEQAGLTLTGKVLGNFDMELRNGAELTTFVAHGPFTVELTLHPGLNYLELRGTDPAGRQVFWAYAVFYKTPPTYLSLHQTGPNLIPDGASTTTVTAMVRDVAGNVSFDYTGTVTFTSSNPAAVSVLTPEVAVVNGQAIATLHAGTIAEPAHIIASAPGLQSADIIIMPVGQVVLSADPARLSADGTARGTLSVKLVGVVGPAIVELNSSNPGAVYFDTGASTTVTVNGGEAQVALHATAMVGSAWITGMVTNLRGISVRPVLVDTVITGMPYQLMLDAVPDAQAGTPQQAVVRVFDVMGNQVSSAGPLVDVVVERIGPDGASEVLGTATTSYGKAVIPFVTPAAGAYTLRVSGRVQGMWDLCPGQVTYTVN